MNPVMVLGGSSKQAPNPSNVVAVESDLFGNPGALGLGATRVTWTNPDSSLYDGLQLWRKLDAGSFTQIATPPKGTTSYVDGPGQSYDVTYRVIATKTGGSNSGNADSNVVRTVPGAPSIQNFYVSSYNGGMTMDATSPGHAKISGFDVAISTDSGANWGTTTDTGADPDHVFSGVAHWSNCKVRCRTRDSLGQTSAWTVYPAGTVLSVNDTTGPTAPAITVNGWDDYNKGFSLAWAAHNDAASPPISGTLLQVRYNGGGWSNVGVLTPGGAQTNFFHGIADENRGQVVEYRLITTDQYGNTTTGAASTPTTAKPKGTFVFGPSATQTYETAGTASWRVDTDDVISGYADGTYAFQTGCFFYGTQIGDTCKGYAPDTARINLVRNGSNGYSGNNWIQGHGNTASPGGTTAPTLVGSTDAGPNLTGSNAAADYDLPSGFKTNMGNGTLKGIATIHTDVPGGHAHAGAQQCYRRLYGNSAGQWCGLMTLIFN